MPARITEGRYDSHPYFSKEWGQDHPLLQRVKLWLPVWLRLAPPGSMSEAEAFAAGHASLNSKSTLPHYGHDRRRMITAYTRCRLPGAPRLMPGDRLLVPLASGLTRRTDHVADQRPRVAVSASNGNGVGQASFGSHSLLEGLTDYPKSGRVGNVVRTRFMLLEAIGELVRLFKDGFQAAGHRHHLKYLLRAGMACTITGPSSEVTTPIS